VKKQTYVLVVLGLALILVSAAAAAQDKAPQVDMKKILAEVSGTYEMDMQGQIMALTFFEKDGKLFGAPEGETPEEILPVKGDNPLKFEVTLADNGNHFEITFGRNEKGEVDKCTLNFQGMEVVGPKKKK